MRLKEIIILIIVINLCGCSDSRRKSNTGTKITEEGKYSNREKEGLWVKYKGNDTIGKYQYSNGLLDGVVTLYDSSGGVSVKRQYKNDTLVYETNFYPNGNILAEGRIVNGVQNGEWKHYHKNGTLSNVTRMVNGKPTGRLINYYPNGVIKLKGGDHFGNGVFEHYDSAGNLMWKIRYIQGQPKDTLEYYEP